MLDVLVDVVDDELHASDTKSKLEIATRCIAQNSVGCAMCALILILIRSANK